MDSPAFRTFTCCVDFADANPPEPWGPPQKWGSHMLGPARSQTVNKILQKESQPRSRYGIHGCFHHLTPSLHSFGRAGQEPSTTSSGQLVDVGHRSGPSMAPERSVSCLHESVEAGLPIPTLPPTALQCLPCWLRPGSQDPDTTAGPAHSLLPSLPLQGRNVMGTGMPNAPCALCSQVPAAAVGAGLGNPVHFLPWLLHT